MNSPHKFNLGDIVRVTQVYCWGLENGPHIWVDHPAVGTLCEIVYTPCEGSDNYFIKLVKPFVHNNAQQWVSESWGVAEHQIIPVYVG